MKKVVTVEEVDGEGLIALLDKNVMLFCSNYIYAGILKGVNDTCILLENAGIVYETGPFNSDTFKDIQRFKNPIYISTQAIESFGETNKK